VKPVSGKQMCKALERKGWTLVRVRGSHHVYRLGNRPPSVPVPVHGNQTLKRKTQRNIMRAAGLTDDDL
jgi:predicted RNA binding protein YcfA (HicA-like mRNA interferase family)